MRALLLLLLAVPASAHTITYGEPASTEELVGPLIGNGMPTTPLKDGRLSVKVVGGLLTAKKDPKDAALNGPGGFKVSGFGATASLLYSLTDHWGVGFMVSQEQVEGDSTPLIVRVAGTGNDPPILASAGGKDALKQTAEAHFGYLAYDPFSGEGFRLPLFVGLGFYDATETRKGSGVVDGDTGHLSLRTRRDGFQPAFGLVPQGNAGSFRWALFAMFAPVGNTRTKGVLFNETDDDTTAIDVKEEEGGNAMGAVGLELTYRPWNLGLVYLPPFIISRGSIGFLSLKWGRTWG